MTTEKAHAFLAEMRARAARIADIKQQLTTNKEQAQNLMEAPLSIDDYAEFLVQAVERAFVSSRGRLLLNEQLRGNGHIRAEAKVSYEGAKLMAERGMSGVIGALQNMSPLEVVHMFFPAEVLSGLKSVLENTYASAFVQDAIPVAQRDQQLEALVASNQVLSVELAQLEELNREVEAAMGKA